MATATCASRPTALLDLPIELLHTILSYLDTNSYYLSLFVCRRLRHAAFSSRQLLLRQINQLPGGPLEGCSNQTQDLDKLVKAVRSRAATALCGIDLFANLASYRPGPSHNFNARSSLLLPSGQRSPPSILLVDKEQPVVYMIDLPTSLVDSPKLRAQFTLAERESYGSKMEILLTSVSRNSDQLAVLYRCIPDPAYRSSSGIPSFVRDALYRAKFSYAVSLFNTWSISGTPNYELEDTFHITVPDECLRTGFGEPINMTSSDSAIAVSWKAFSATGSYSDKSAWQPPKKSWWTQTVLYPTSRHTSHCCDHYHFDREGFEVHGVDDEGAPATDGKSVTGYVDGMEYDDAEGKNLLFRAAGMPVPVGFISTANLLEDKAGVRHQMNCLVQPVRFGDDDSQVGRMVVGAPFYIGHKKITSENTDDSAVGDVESVDNQGVEEEDDNSQADAEEHVEGAVNDETVEPPAAVVVDQEANGPQGAHQVEEDEADEINIPQPPPPPIASPLCYETYLSLAIRRRTAEAFILRSSRTLTADLCATGRDAAAPFSHTRRQSWSAIAKLKGFSAVELSRAKEDEYKAPGGIVAFSVGGTRVARANWRNLKIWPIDAIGFSREEIGRGGAGYVKIDGFEVNTSGAVVHQLGWTSEDILWGFTDRGLMRWDVGPETLGKVTTADIEIRGVELQQFRGNGLGGKTYRGWEDTEDDCVPNEALCPGHYDYRWIMREGQWVRSRYSWEHKTLQQFSLAAKADKRRSQLSIQLEAFKPKHRSIAFPFNIKPKDANSDSDENSVLDKDRRWWRRKGWKNSVPSGLRRVLSRKQKEDFR